MDQIAPAKNTACAAQRKTSLVTKPPRLATRPIPPMQNKTVLQRSLRDMSFCAKVTGIMTANATMQKI